MVGLSLCIQGTYQHIRLFFLLHRFIPVHTGNIISNGNSSAIPTVYPCAYREHSKLQRDSRRIPRFIPVHTGNIDYECFYYFLISVYPCAYREHYQYMKMIYDHTRFIPVHTGNIPIITYCFIIKILTPKFLPIF